MSEEKKNVDQRERLPERLPPMDGADFLRQMESLRDAWFRQRRALSDKDERLDRAAALLIEHGFGAHIAPIVAGKRDVCQRQAYASLCDKAWVLMNEFFGTVDDAKKPAEEASAT